MASKYDEWAEQEEAQPPGAVKWATPDTGVKKLDQMLIGDSKYDQMFKAETARERIDKVTGGPAKDRFLASIKITPTGKVNFLADRYGHDNVKMDNRGEILYRNAPQDEWIQFDESGLTWKDMADFGGEGIEATPGVAALAFGPVGSNPLTQTGAAVVGDVVRQMLSEYLPGDEGMTTQDRMKRSAFTGIMGGATEFGAHGALELINHTLNPGNIAKKYILKYTDDATLAEGNRLAGETGVPLSPGQLSLSRRAFLLENYLRQNITVADWMAESQKRQLHRAGAFFDKTINKITTTVPGKSTAGYQAVTGYRNFLKTMIKTRSKEGKRLFGEVERLGGGDEFISFQNTTAAIDDMIEKLQVPFGTDTTNVQVKRLAEKRDEIADLRVSPSKLQRILEVWGKAAKGLEDPIQELDKAANMRVGRRVFKALQKDFDDAITFADMAAQTGKDTMPLEALQALKTARDAWKTSSEAIDLASDTIMSKTLGYLDDFGDGGERFVNNLFTNKWTPSELKRSFKQLDTIDPDMTDGVRRAYLEEMLSKSEPGGGDLYEGVASKFSPQKMNTLIRNNRDRLESIFYNKPQFMKDIDNMYGVTSRMITGHGMGRSPTQPLQATENWVVSLTRGAQKLATGQIQEVHSDLARIMAPRVMAKILLDPKGRKQMLQLSKVKTWSKKSLALLSRLVEGYDIRDELASRVIEDPDSYTSPPAGIGSVVKP